MFEWEIKELPFAGWDLLVEGARNCTIGNAAGECIGSKNARTATKHVAGKLVEDDHEGERRFGRRLPVPQLACHGGFIRSEKERLDFCIESIVLVEPFCGSGRSPKGEHRGG